MPTTMPRRTDWAAALLAPVITVAYHLTVTTLLVAKRLRRASQS